MASFVSSSPPPPIYDVVVVGSGIAGLLTAEMVLTSLPNSKVLVLERNNAVGGRAQVERRLLVLQTPPLISAEPGHGSDVILQDLYGGGQRVTTDTGGQLLACGPGAERIEGGVGGIPLTLSASIQEKGGEVKLNTEVKRVKVVDGRVTLNEDVQARYVVIAAPPQLIATNVEFDPPLPSSQLSTMLSTQTWMHGTGKAIIEYASPWWSVSGLNLCSTGTSRLGGHIDVTWDNSDYTNGKYAIGMFVSEGANEDNVREEIEVIFGGDGENVKGIERVTVKVWDDVGIKGLSASTATYGSETLRMELGGRVVFSGTETEDEHGHIEGAVISGERAAKTVLAKIKGDNDKMREGGECAGDIRAPA
ncbi:hypothetical protein TrST_g8984 [Triparma strigata]|uniref:monoamine oxidase n=1 Tax=Triparma strigata TaxID=1606541 RepID=A0A9W7EMS9_9STRA|nr:hypothetical protein TrST_g8984 [Triparma strigata]